jgi:hypothetical protein
MPKQLSERIQPARRGSNAHDRKRWSAWLGNPGRVSGANFLIASDRGFGSGFLFHIFGANGARK